MDCALSDITAEISETFEQNSARNSNKQEERQREIHLQHAHRELLELRDRQLQTVTRDLRQNVE